MSKVTRLLPWRTGTGQTCLSVETSCYRLLQWHFKQSCGDTNIEVQTFHITCLIM